MSIVSPEQPLPWAVWQQKLVLSIFHLKLYTSFPFLLLIHTPCNFVLPDDKIWNGAGIARGCVQGRLPSSGSAAAELTSSSSGLSHCLWDLMAEKGALIPAPCLNPKRNNCTIPTCRVPCGFSGLSCTSCPRSVCPALLLLPCCLLLQAWLGLP